MAPFFLMEKEKTEKTDSLILALTVFLTSFGLVMLFSASYFHGERLVNNPYFFVLWQSMHALVGILGAWILSRLDLVYLPKVLPWLVLVALVMMVLPLLPVIGRDMMGARRWVYIGKFSFQPAEFARVIFLLYMAFILAKKEDQLDTRPRDTMVPPFLVTAAFAVLSLLQNDFSTAIFFLLLAVSFFLLAGVQARYVVPFVFLGTSVGFINLFAKDYRLLRVMTFLNPQHDPQGAGYQVLASQKALMEGGLWGVGLGGGERKLGRLPEVHNDFIFAVVGEELGFLGVAVVFALFAVLCWRGYQVALKSTDRFGFYLAFGISTSLIFQFLINVGVVVGVIPATGVPLPFFSAGGSALLMTLLTMGLLLNVSRRTKGGTL